MRPSSSSNFITDPKFQYASESVLSVVICCPVLVVKLTLKLSLKTICPLELPDNLILSVFSVTSPLSSVIVNAKFVSTKCSVFPKPLHKLTKLPSSKVIPSTVVLPSSPSKVYAAVFVSVMSVVNEATSPSLINILSSLIARFSYSINSAESSSISAGTTMVSLVYPAKIKPISPLSFTAKLNLRPSPTLTNPSGETKVSAFVVEYVIFTPFAIYDLIASGTLPAVPCISIPLKLKSGIFQLLLSPNAPLAASFTSGTK